MIKTIKYCNKYILIIKIKINKRSFLYYIIKSIVSFSSREYKIR